MLTPTRWRFVEKPTRVGDENGCCGLSLNQKRIGLGSKPVGNVGVSGSISTIFTRFHGPATRALTIPLLKQFVSPRPHQGRGGLHPNVVHHPQIEGTKLIQTTPISEQRIISVSEKRVIKLLPQALFKGSKTGKIHNKSTRIKFLGTKPKGEAAAVAVHKTAMTLVGPLAMATGIALEQLAAAEGSGGNGHNTDEEGNGMNAAGGSRLGK